MTKSILLGRAPSRPLFTTPDGRLRWTGQLLRLFLCFVIAWCQIAAPAYANVITLTQADVGTTGATSSYSYSSGTYTLSGAGAGIAGYADACSTAFMKTNGNVEIIARVATQSNITGNDFAGVMIRDTLAVGSPMACMGVEPSHGAHFIDRYFAGGYASDTSGPPVTAPTWVRLTYNATTQYVQGYQSNDGLYWTLVSGYYANLSSSFYVGFAVTSASTGTLSTATFDNVSFMANVPQTTGALQPALWLRSDVGVTASAGQVSQWNDQSTSANNATQSTSASQPTITASAVNGVAAINFNGSSQYMTLGPGLAFGSGITSYVVLNPTATSASARLFDFGNGSGNSNFTMQQASSDGAAVYMYNSATPSSFTASSALTQSVFQSLSAFIGTNGAGTPITLYTNGVSDGSSTIYNPGYIYRSNNYIGTSYGATSDFFQGSIAEILIFPTTLTGLQKISVDAYLYGKYGVGSEPVLPPVVITPSTSVVTGQTNNLTMTSAPGAIIYYTSDGTSPDPATSPIYTTALTATDATYQAIAVMPFATTSTVATSVIKVDPSAASVPTAGLQQWLMADYQVTVNGSNQVSQWFDMSGNANSYVQSSSGNKPILTSDLLQGWPAVVFDGSASYLQAPSGLANFAGGLSIFAVTTPSAFSANARILDCGVGSANENFILRQYTGGGNGGIGFDTYNGTSGSTVTAPSGSLVLNRGQLVEAFLNTTPTGAISLNGTSLNSGAMNALNNITRTGNYIGTNNGAAGNFLPGSISEMLLYSGVLTGPQINGVEQYLLQKYQLIPTLQAPIFSPPSGTTFPTDAQVAIIAPPECQVRYTIDGSSPGPTSTLYVGPIMDNVSSLTVKAISLQAGYPNSAVQTATYTVTSP